jgi:hypothetical protein
VTSVAELLGDQEIKTLKGQRRKERRGDPKGLDRTREPRTFVGRD